MSQHRKQRRSRTR